MKDLERVCLTQVHKKNKKRVYGGRALLASLLGLVLAFRVCVIEAVVPLKLVSLIARF
jgi:hypothetical protein